MGTLSSLVSFAPTLRTVHSMFGGGVCFGAMHAPQGSDAALRGMAQGATLLALKEPLSRLVPFEGTSLSKDSDGGRSKYLCFDLTVRICDGERKVGLRALGPVF